MTNKNFSLDLLLLNLDINHIKSMMDLDRKSNFWTTILTLVAVMLFGLCFAFSTDQNEKHIKQLQEDVMLLHCEKDAAKIGAGYAFIAKGDKSECHVLYND